MKIFNLQFSICKKILIWVLLLIAHYALFIGAASASVLIEVDTGAETVNAVSGTLRLSAPVAIDGIYTGSSAVLIWIAPPAVSSDGRTITFAGLSPGGFKGKRPLFTIDGPSLEDLSGATFEAADAYKNDGKGTPALVRFSLANAEIIEDNDPPEPFTPIIASSPEIFDGRYFLSFMAQDKGTGIERFEYASSWLFKPRDNSSWVQTQSPQVLTGIERFKRLHIRAIDGEGNFRAVSTAGPYWPITLVIGLIIVVCVALFITRSLSLPSSPSSSR